MLRTAILSALTAIGVATATSAQQAPAAALPVVRGRLVGVYDERTGQPLENVEARNMLNGISALTTSTGTVLLSFVDSGGALMSFKKVGYEELTMVVASTARDTTPLTLILRPLGQVLPAVITKAKADDEHVDYISPGLKAFEERRHQGFGRFVAEAELRKHDSDRLHTVILKNIPGIQLVQPPCPKRGSGGCPQYLAAMRGHNSVGGGPCYLTIYMDGALFYSSRGAGSGEPPDPKNFFANEYAGIEFYAGGSVVPPQYNGTDGGCGVLLLWSRER